MLNVAESVLFLVAVGLAYAATGTVNLADLAVRLADVPAPVRDALGLLLLVVFGTKAALFPLFFWLPGQLPRRADAGRRDLRRAAHEGRRVCADPQPGHCCSARRDRRR